MCWTCSSMLSNTSVSLYSNVCKRKKERKKEKERKRVEEREREREREGAERRVRAVGGFHSLHPFGPFTNFCSVTLLGSSLTRTRPYVPCYLGVTKPSEEAKGKSALKCLGDCWCSYNISGCAQGSDLLSLVSEKRRQRR